MSATLKQTIADNLGNNQRIETRQIRPTTAFGAANGSVRFKLPQTGLLHPGAFVTLKLVVKNGTEGWLPLSAGILSMVRRAVLYNGNKAVMSVDNANVLMTLKRHYATMEERSQKDGVRHGTIDSFMVSNDGAEAQMGRYKLDNEQYQITYNNDRTASSWKVPYRVKDNAAESPEFIIKLSQLFPSFLSGMTIPLGLCRDPWSLELQFSEDVAGSRVCYTKGEVFHVGNVIDTDSLKLIVDLLYYSTPEGEIGVMESLTEAMNSESGISFEYTDVVSIVTNIPAVADPGAGNVTRQSVNRLCGMVGENLRNLLIATPRHPTGSDVSTNGENSGNGMLGRYFSHAAQGEQTLQLKVNNKPVYPNIGSGLHGDAQHFDQVSQVYGLPMNVNVGQYSSETSLQANAWAAGQQQAISDHTFELYDQNELRAMYQWLGVPLQLTRANVAGAGVAIGTAPVELLIDRTRSHENHGLLDVFVFGEVERSFTLKQGIVFLSGL
jgi:hypothetical protein